MNLITINRHNLRSMIILKSCNTHMEKMWMVC